MFLYPPVPKRAVHIYEAWNCMSHLQTEGPRKARKEKDDMISSTLMREAIMSFFFPFRTIIAGLWGILCNDESFLGFQFAREEHNASLISDKI